MSCFTSSRDASFSYGDRLGCIAFFKTKSHQELRGNCEVFKENIKTKNADADQNAGTAIWDFYGTGSDKTPN